MKKNELLHVHALLATVAEEFHEEGRLGDGDLTAYAGLEATPTSVRLPKADHEDAVLELARVLGDAAAPEEAEAVAIES